MAKNKELQFGIKNVKYATKSGDLYSAPKDLAYADGLALDPNFSTLQVFGDGEIIAELASDKGLTGTLTIVQPSQDYEIDMKRKIKLADGSIADITVQELIPHAIYYEVNVSVNNQTKVAKCWLLNVLSQKPSESQNQSNPDPVINNLEINLTILGDNLFDTAGTDVYVDANGLQYKAYRVVSKPGDTNYATFGESVPKATIPSLTED